MTGTYERNYGTSKFYSINQIPIKHQKYQIVSILKRNNFVKNSFQINFLEGYVKHHEMLMSCIILNLRLIHVRSIFHFYTTLKMSQNL